MNKAQALHALARRYCERKHAHWCDIFSQLPNDGRARDGYNHSDEALATFPRYNVLNAIRIELGRIDASKIQDLSITRALILAAAAGAQDDFTRDHSNPIAADAMAQERTAFHTYVSGLSDSDLIDVQPLPYKRTLSDDESTELWSELRTRWKVSENYWFPLVEKTVDCVEAFSASAFFEFRESGQLRSLLKSREVTRVWELREYGPEFEEDLAAFDPFYNGAEGYWFSDDGGWVVYMSHEDSVTIGGWLLEDVKIAWPDWQQSLWKYRR